MIVVIVVEPYWTLEGHTDSVHCALFSNNSDRILTGYTAMHHISSTESD